MKRQIKAIETLWQGVYYRSRLETRWGIFFRSIGLPANYEMQGWELAPNIRYLPDFHLPTIPAYVEVKPEHISEEEELRLTFIRGLWADTNKGALWILRGQPGIGTYALYCSTWPDEQVYFMRCRKCNGVCLVDICGNSWGPIGKHECRENDRWPEYGYADELREAAKMKLDHLKAERLIDPCAAAEGKDGEG